jgi:uncharacterized membrane protein
MLIAYLARHGFFTVEMGIASAVLTGIVLIFLGWRLRKKRPVYFLILQGGGIGILYLSIFAAYKLTPYFPAPVTLILMSLLIPPAVVLAVFQFSQPLAVFGFLGGFAAPVLLSAGGGNHVFFFSYYLILNAGVFAIAFFRSWKGLNLLAFAGTFGASIYWVLNSYTRALFATAEPFLVMFILLYTALGLRSVKNGEYRLNHFSDGIIILGTPFAAALLQWRVFSFVEHGHAFAALIFSGIYLCLTVLLLRRGKKEFIRPYAEGYLGLAVLLANIAIPLELASEITSAVWAAEGALVFFFGLRVSQRKTKNSLWDWKIEAAGIVIHAAAAAAFFSGSSRFSRAFPGWHSPVFSGSLIIALSALAMAIMVNKVPPRQGGKFVRLFSAAALIWGLIWWFGGWYFEFNRVFENSGEAFFILLSLSALGLYGGARLFSVPAFYMGLAPAPAFALIKVLERYISRLWNIFRIPAEGVFTFNFFNSAWYKGWLIFFALQALLLVFTVREKGERKKLLGLWIFIDLIVFLGALSPSGRYLTGYLALSSSWTSFAGLLPLFAAVVLLSLFGPPRKRFSAGETKLLFLALPLILCSILGVWFLVTLFRSGDPAPLPLYIPLVNPLDLLEGFCVGVSVFWLLGLKKKGGGIRGPKKSGVFVLTDAAIFIWVIAILARSVHFYGGAAYNRIAETDAFHLSFFVFCALYGIAHIIGGHRLPHRTVWITGAVLTVADIAKLLLFDMAGIGILYRILSFFIAGVILLFIGWVAPLPPARELSGEEPK